MKKIHGNILIILFIFLAISLNANNKYCIYSIKSSKSSVVVNEAFYITFHVKQKDISQVMFFDLKPMKSKNYETLLLNEKRHEFSYHNAEKTFTYLIYAKKSGSIKIKFNFRVRLASDDAVAQAYVGSRDNVKSIPTIKVDIDKPFVSINTKNLNPDTHAVGNFKIQMSIDKKHSNSYDAVNVLYKIEGIGYLDESFRPITKIDGTSIFNGSSELKPIAVKDGFIYKEEFRYAIVAKKSFTIPEIKFKIFNTISRKYEQIIIPKKDIKITPLNIKALLDDKENPKSINYTEYIKYIYDILIFIAGFLSAILYKYISKKRVKTKKESCCNGLKNTKTAMAALKVLIPIINRKDIRDEIEKLENVAYANEDKSTFNKIKADLIKKLSK